jgi:hypothetical protein
MARCHDEASSSDSQMVSTVLPSFDTRTTFEPSDAYTLPQMSTAALRPVRVPVELDEGMA